ncbi:hypothetical protein [Sorlinia euscelidii]
MSASPQQACRLTATSSDHISFLTCIGPSFVAFMRGAQGAMMGRHVGSF